MSNRDKAYLWNVPTNVVQLISIASRISLYLVDQSDVMDFTFKDRLGKVNSVHIGARVYCTCQQKMEHCLHSIYVLLKIFKLPADNPLIWQISYLQSEIIDIITGKYSVQKVNQMIASSIIQNSVNLQRDKNNKVQRLKINEQSVCSICQQSMKLQMSLSYCRTGCGNNFHTNCLKIWIDHKQGTQGKVTCPMCRCQYNKQNLQSIIKEQESYLKKEYKINITKQKFSCQQCGQKPIISNIYKCLFCQMFCLCQQCFQNKKHLKHPFVQFQNGQWLPALRKQTINTQEQEQSKDEYITLFDYIIDSYPYVSKYLAQNIDQNRKLKFSIEQCKCFSCANDKLLFLRRLPCGHYVDDACAKDLISKNKMYCYIDGSKFLKGYQNLLKIDEEVDKKVQSTLKQQNIQRQYFLDQKVSQFSSEDYQEQIPIYLDDIIEVSYPQPILIPIQHQIKKNISRNIQHLPPIIKKQTQSVMKSVIKQPSSIKNIPIQLQKKKPFSSKVIRSSSIKNHSQNKKSDIKGSLKRMFF